MRSFFRNRRIRKNARDLLHHARHFRHMREDVLSARELSRLHEVENALRAALQKGNVAEIEKGASELHACIAELTPRRALPWIRDNLEVLVVAIAVAMAFRTYFAQPFKIPTGSMQPTLYGIHARPVESPSWLDRFPLKLAKWLVTGDWYLEVNARTSGFVMGPPVMERRGDGSAHILYISNEPHEIPTTDGLRVRVGEFVQAGTVVWRGVRTAGDHVLVDKVRWNFTRPKRGDVIVFNTERIPTLPRGTFYIKRLVAMPGETLSIHPPNLIVNGRIVTEPKSIQRVASCADGYAGYRLPDPRAPGWQYCVLRTPDSVIHLKQGDYFALGDNTMNSRDSRYWGPVPEANLVGPAVLVYWPFSSRWLRID